MARLFTSHRLSVLVAFCAILMGVPSVTSAQDRTTPPLPIGELSVGYNYVRHSSVDYDGWLAGGAVNLTRWFGVAGELTGGYERGTGLYSGHGRRRTLMGGPRFVWQSGHVVPFAQVLVGVAQDRIGIGGPNPTWKSYGALQPGGGVNVLLVENIGIRIGADYQAIQMPSGSDNSFEHEFRFTSGLMIGWGAR